MQTNTLKENKMGVMPVGKLLLNMALPMVVSMLVQALYNVVDSIYVSQISESAVTALSLAFPVQNMQIGFAVGIGVGVNSLLSKSLGQKNQDAANKAAGNGAFLMLCVAVAFVLFGFFGTRPYFEMQSDVTETVEGGIVYTRICSILSLGIFVEILGERPCSGDVNQLDHKTLINRFCDIAEAETGARPNLRSGSTDCNWPLSLGVPAVCFGGYTGHGAHTREESIELDSLPMGFSIVLTFIMGYYQEN